MHTPQEQIIIPQRKKRIFLPEDFQVTKWEPIQPFYKQLLERELTSVETLKKWFEDVSELASVVSEDAGWRYIHMTCDTANESYRKSYQEYVKEILPQLIPVTHQLHKKAMQCPFIQELRKEVGYDILIRNIKSNITIYRPENVAIFTKTRLEAQEYSTIMGAMTVDVEGKELTLQQAAAHLESEDRSLREKVYLKIGERRLKDKDKLNDLYTSMVKHRHQIAVNADFANFRDYMFVELKRFEYTPKDCFEFHQSIAEEVVPLLNDLAKDRKKQLNIDTLKPWDNQVDPLGKPPLRPFRNGEELLEKTIIVFDRLDPFLGNCLRIMKKMGHLDLTSRKGKAPGGYNHTLDETGVPFIFMNATSTQRDMETLLHEGGHAIHSFLMRDLPNNNFKHPTSEIAEIASMSMESISIDHWDVFFDNEDELKRAKKKHLTQIITILPWIATIDKFQHWVYENPHHTLEQRKTTWNEIFDSFSDTSTDWSGQEAFKDFLWQKQLHLFEVPFYYIEYGIAQLGAIAIWKNYKENPRKGLQAYLDALKLGYTKSVPQIYEAAGIVFNFSRPYVKELMQFIKATWEELD